MVSQKLDEAFHGGTHQAGFQNQGTTKGCGEESGQGHQQPDGIDGEGHILQYRVQEEIQDGATQRDVQNLKQFGFSESKVKSMLMRTRLKLKNILEEEGFQ